MANISPFDVIYLTVVQHGITCIRTTLTGIKSLADIVSRVRDINPRLCGLLSVDVRNTSEGWSSRHSVFIR